MSKYKPERAAPPEAFLSPTPWHGFGRGDVKRVQPLDVCPDARCRRAKACIAAQDDLFCQRTHLSDLQRQHLEAERRREFDRRFPPIADELPLELHQMRLEAIFAARREKDAEMTARWKAGVLNHLYDKWRAKGALMQLPPKTYKE